jgi:outer membrane receptor protein involved in Fe transport
MWNVGGWLPVALVCAPGIALAQAPANVTAAHAARPGAAASGRTVEEVTVTGAAAEAPTSIDRRSYSLGKDLQATSGSISDALRNLPSVEVDLQGNISLRGDPNITILVDGKPSGVFNGPARADALQQLPADQIERVEVITNPSAALTPEGSGGVINLITKKSRGAGKSGSVNLTVGSAGLKRGGGTFGYNSRKLSVTGYLSGNYQSSKLSSIDDRGVLDPRSGHFLNSRVTGSGRNLVRGPTARLDVGYDLDPKTRLTAQISYNGFLRNGQPLYRFEDDGADGAPASLFYRQGGRRFTQDDVGLSAGWRRQFGGEGHELSVDLSHSDSASKDQVLWRQVQSLPPAADTFDLDRNDATLRHTELKIAYSRPMAGRARLKTGYELRRDDNEYDSLVDRGPSPGVLVRDPGVSNVFLFEQTIHAIYGTYERPFGDLTAQAGLRIEALRMTLDQTTSRRIDHIRYSGVYPTLHLAYKLGDGRQLSASYSKRVQRPAPRLLNSFRIFNDPRTMQQGNPALKPEETQSFELGYERRKPAATYVATLYYRQNKGDVSPVLRDLGNAVFLSTFNNLGQSRAAGLELVANGHLTKALSYNLSGNFSWAHIDASNLADAGARSAFGIAGRANLNWQAGANDLLQINATGRGRGLGAQGYAISKYTLNLGWRHKFDDRIAMVITAQDLLASDRFGYTLKDSQTLRDTFRLRPVSRALLVRLDYRFGAGGKPSREPGFEYESNPAPSL